jgi:YVTN family beta-propeller protein
VAVNPATNKIYVANQYSGNVTVIDGATSTTSTVSVGSNPVSVAVNTVTNKIYVANNGGNVTLIDGATNSTTTLAAGMGPSSVAVNPITNKIYVANNTSNNVTVIDGATNTSVNVATGAKPMSVAVNQTTNKIYVTNLSSANVTVIDGATNTTSTVGAGSSPMALAVNPVTNRIYVANNVSGNVTAIAEQQVQAIPLTVTVNPLLGNMTPSSTPSFTFSASSTFSPIPTIPDGVYYQVDTWQGAWTAATGSNPSFAGAVGPLQPGFHILYFYVGDGQEATSTQASGQVISSIQAYGFLSGAGPSLPSPTVTFTGAPASAAYQSTFSVSATTNASTTASITAAGACSLAGTLVTMTGGTGTCSLSASWAADTTYAAATASQSTAAVKIAPTVTFTGAPVSAGLNAMFTVASTTNASTTASITAAGACSISGNTVTITSGTGTCSLTANWAADNNYSAATASQSTAANTLPPPTVTFTGAPASATYKSTFSVSATTNASTTASISAAGACSIAGNLVSMTSGTGTCSLTANWAADSTYASATASQSTAASKIAPTVTFTGAPASAPYKSTFGVATTTNATTAASITSSGACTFAGNTVSMSSGTGTCALTANWAADNNYTSATVGQSTAAVKIAPTVTFTGAPASAPVNTTFRVATTTNASTSASITPAGVCTILGNTVTMTSGTGTCTLSASWASDSNYTTATASQNTTATNASAAVRLQVASTNLVYPNTTSASVCVTPAGSVTPTGSVTILDGPTPLTTQPLQGNGCANWNISPALNAGMHSLTAFYPGDGSNPSGTSGIVSVTVSPTPTYLSAGCSSNSFSYGANYRCTVSIGSSIGSGTGVITYIFDNGTPVVIPVNGGIAQVSLATPHAGSHALVIGYAAQGNFGASTVTENLNISRAQTKIQITPSNYYPATGSQFTLSVSLTGSSAPPPSSGVVTFLDNGVVLGTGNVNVQGQTSLTIGSIPAGSHAYTAQFGGLPDYATASAISYVTAR